MTAGKNATKDFAAAPGEPLAATLGRVRALSHSQDSALIDRMVGGPSSQPLVRYWGVMALGGIHHSAGVDGLIQAAGDRVKMLRDAAAWALEQTLLDDAGFEAVFTAYDRGSDRVRETVLKALGMRADAVLTRPDLNLSRLARLVDRALNDDPHPGVRAWAAKAAWQWWIWNPPVRGAVQSAWVRRLLTPEPNALVEQCLRYQSHALFIANGHKANASERHQYPELESLFRALEAELERPGLAAERRDLLARRLVRIAATFYNTSGGDGGLGQMGYVTAGSGEAVGKAVLHHWDKSLKLQSQNGIRLSLEAAAGVTFPDLQNRLTRYATEGPEQFRTLAAAAVADPSAVTLPGSQEQVQPMVEQIHRGAQDHDRRQSLAEPVLKLMSRTRWALPQNAEQQSILYQLLVPVFDRMPDEAALTKILQEAERAAQFPRQTSADWFIAKRTGEMLASNPDLHTERLAHLFPRAVKNPMEAHFWLSSLDWLATYGDPLPEVTPAQEPEQPSPELLAARRRGRQLLLEMLAPEAPEMSRRTAIRIAHLTSYRRDSQVLRAVKNLLESEPIEGIREPAQNLLRTEPTVWIGELKAAVETEPLAVRLRDSHGKALLSPEFMGSFRYFSDHVASELNRPQRQDEKACMSCHGVPGRVPSMELEKPAAAGFLPASKMLKNYLILQDRVDLQDIEKSKLLRKPLNVQTGQEDGHQGGRRYSPSDRGYQIIRRWVLDQPRVQQSLARPGRDTSQTVASTTPLP